MKRLLLLLTLAVLCVWALYAFVYRPLRCNREVSEMQARTNLASETADSYRASILARENLNELRRLETCCRTTVQVYFLEANNFDVLGRKEEAVAALRSALRVDQRPEIYWNIGTLLVELGRMDEAVDNYVVATRLTPEIAIHIPSPEAARRAQERLAALARARGQ